MVIKRRRLSESASDQATVGRGAIAVRVEGTKGTASMVVSIADVGWAAAWLPGFLLEAWRRGGVIPPGVSAAAEVLDPRQVLPQFRLEENVAVTEA